MSSEIAVFWLLHFVIGVLMPFLMFSGCCRAQEPQPVEGTRRHEG